MWYVYILQCRDKTLYTGITNDLKRRINQHNAGDASKYTRSRRPVVLVFKEPHDDKPSALKREAYIKKLKRNEKVLLVQNS